MYTFKKSTISLLFIATFLSIMLVVPVAAEEPVHNKYALVVGVNGGEATHLDNDAQDFANVLQTVYGYPSGNIQLLLNSGATKSAVLAGLNWLGTQEAGSSDALTIFIASHGSENALHLSDDFLWDYELASALAGYESHNILVVIVACRSGSFIDVADAFQLGLVVTACQADELTLDIGLFANTIFVEYFVDRGMSQGLADANSDGLVSVQEAYNYAYANCANPPGALSATHPQMVDNYEEEYILSTPIHAPWFTNLLGVLAISIAGYAVYTKKRKKIEG